MAPQILLPSGDDAHGHERALERRIRLVDGYERDASSNELRRDVHESVLVGNRQRDGESAFGEIPRTRFARCVDDLRGLNSAR